MFSLVIIPDRVGHLSHNVVDKSGLGARAFLGRHTHRRIDKHGGLPYEREQSQFTRRRSSMAWLLDSLKELR